VNFTAPSSLTVAGELEIQAGGRLRLDNSSPARDLTLLAGSVLSGTGTIQLDGSNRLVVPGDLDTTVAIVLNGGGTRLVVPGTYTIRSSGSVVGTVEASVIVVKSNAVVTATSSTFTGLVTVEDGATLRLNGGTVSFGTNVLIAAGARWEVPLSTTINLSGVLTNRGTLRWVSRNNVFDLGGSGRVENLGLWEVFVDPANPGGGSESVVRVPVNVPAGGRFLVSTGLVNFTAPSSLTVAGELEIQAGGRLRLDNSSPARDLTLAAGSVNSGSGTLKFEGGNRLILDGNTALGIGLADFLNSSSLVSSNTLTIAPGATVRFDHSSTINGPVIVNGTLTLNNASATLRINAALTLNAAGTINNSGTLSVAAFVNNGGTINGNAPVVGGLSALRISEIQLFSITLTASTAVEKQMVLKWSAAPARIFAVECSSNLTVWAEQQADIREITPGQYKADLGTTVGSNRFFRVRQSGSN